jgi:hypothetical protein
MNTILLPLLRGIENSRALHVVVAVASLGLFATLCLAAPVKVAVSTEGFERGAATSYASGNESSITAEEKTNLIKMLNAKFKDAIGEGKVEFVDAAANADLKRKLFVVGNNTGDRGETSIDNAESFVFEGTIKKTEPARSDRTKLLNAVLFTSLHEAIHLLSGLRNSDHGWEVGQAELDKLVKKQEDSIKKIEMDIARETNADQKKFLEELLMHNKSSLMKIKMRAAEPPNIFTDGNKITGEQIADPAHQVFTNRIKDALNAGVANIMAGKAPGHKSDGVRKLGEFVPVRGPAFGQSTHADGHPDYVYSIDSPLLGDDLLTPALTIGLIDDVGEFVPFEFDPRQSPSDPLDGIATLEAGHYYELFLHSEATDELWGSASLYAELSFDPLVQFDSALAHAHHYTLTGPYFGRMMIEFDLDNSGTPDVFVRMESLSPWEAIGGDGFIGPFAAFPSPDRVIPNPVPEPTAVALWCLAALSLIAGRRGNMHR